MCELNAAAAACASTASYSGLDRHRWARTSASSLARSKNSTGERSISARERRVSVLEIREAGMGG